MEQNVPHRALRFVGRAAREASKHGVRKGVSKAASKANAALLVVEAVESVASSIGTYLDLRAARTHREKLEEVIEYEAEALEADRERLVEEIEVARAQLEADEEVQNVLQRVVRQCVLLLQQTLEDYNTERNRDLPDLDRLAQGREKVYLSFEKLKAQLKTYQDPAATDVA